MKHALSEFSKFALTDELVDDAQLNDLLNFSSILFFLRQSLNSYKMAKLIETWLNSEVELSHEISNFEDDFANGYLLGELLYKYNQQPDFDAFHNKSTRNYRLNNFSRLIPTFKNLNIKFDSNLINNIMQQKKGTIVELLYQIKMSLEKTNVPIDVAILKRTNKAIETMPIQKIRPAREQYDKMEAQMIQKRLRELNKAQKEVDLENKLVKFRDEAKRQNETNEQFAKTQRMNEDHAKKMKREAQINKLQRSLGFMEDWEQKGIQDWKANMERKKKREQSELTFKIKQAQTFKSKADTMLQSARDETFAGIDEFEQRLKNYTAPSVAKALLTQTSQQERDIKRRSMSSKLYLIEQEQEDNYKIDVIKGKLDIQSSTEEQVNETIASSKYNKDLIAANRKLREAKYLKRKDIDSDLAQIKEEKALERHIENTDREVFLEDHRGKSHTKFSKISRRLEHDDVAEGILDLVLDITDELWDYQQHKNCSDVDDRHWREWMQLFERGISVKSDEALEQELLRDYIFGNGEWKYGEEAVHNYFLGDAIESVIDLNFVSPTSEELVPDIPNDLPIKIALIGFPFSGKMTHCRLLAEKYSLDIIETKKLVQEAAENGGEILETLLEGEGISDQQMVDLVVEAIKKVTNPRGYIIMDFPSTLPQAKLLEQSLSGFLPSDERAEDEGYAKKQIAWKVAPPAYKDAPPVPLVPSGLDHIFYFDIDPKECLRRSFGRRMNNDTGVVYHVEDHQPPLYKSPLIERLVTMDEEEQHRGALVDRIQAIQRNSTALFNWMESFGKGEDQILVHLEASQDIDIVRSTLDKYMDGLIKEHSDNADAVTRKELQEIQDKKDAEVAVVLKAEESIKQRKELTLMIDEDDKEKEALFEPEPANLPDNESIALYEIWEHAQGSFIQRVIDSLECLRKQRTCFTTELKNMQTMFIEFLYRPTDKQMLLSAFQEEFNRFSHENPDMREDPKSIAELHGRVSDLTNALWDKIEEREQQAEEFRQEMMTNKWLENHIEQTVLEAIEMLNSESALFFFSISFLQDFILSKHQLPLNDIPDNAINLYNEVPLLEENSSPRLEKIVENLLSINPMEEKQEETKGKKKEDVKKKGQVEEDLRPPEVDEELNSVIAKQKEVFHYRVNRLCAWTRARIEEMRSQNTTAFSNMRQWIDSNSVSENNGVHELGVYIREHVETMENLQPRLELNTLDFIIHDASLTYVDPPVPPLPPKEKVLNDRLTIVFLKSFIQEFMDSFRIDDYEVDKTHIVNTLNRRIQNTKLQKNYGGISEAWRGLTFSIIYEILNKFDVEATGVVNWREFAVSMCLMNSLPAQANQIENYRKLVAESSPITQETFISIPAWFDATEQNTDEPNSIPFDRVAEIKKLLFWMHSKEENETTVLEEHFLFHHLRKALPLSQIIGALS